MSEDGTFEDLARSRLVSAVRSLGVVVEDDTHLVTLGELDADERTIRTVPRLAERVADWLRPTQTGTLLTGSMTETAIEVWRTLAQPFDGGEPTPRWVAGATVAELAAKLGGNVSTLRDWDDEPLEESAIAAIRLEWGSAMPNVQPVGDTILDAAWAASRLGRTSDSPRGLL